MGIIGFWTGNKVLWQCLGFINKVAIVAIMMLKTWPLCTGAELNLGDRVLGEVEKNSFIALLDKGRHSGLAGSCPEKLCVPTWEDLVRSFIAVVQGQSC